LQLRNPIHATTPVQARDVEKVRADIARGREYRKLEKQRQSVIDQMDAIKRRIAALQG
jgi:hypothetical protein